MRDADPINLVDQYIDIIVLDQNDAPCSINGIMPGICEQRLAEVEEHADTSPMVPKQKTCKAALNSNAC